MDKLVRWQDYFIRHLNINNLGLKWIDEHVPDIQCEVSQNARKNLLKSYVPPIFSCAGNNEICEKKWNLQIVIPMYNAQKYIISCINCIVKQKTKYKYKILVIDDGSTDFSTPMIRAKYKDYPVEVIRQANRGTAVARNTGISKIEADYVMFVDADDILCEGALDRLLDEAYAKDACIVEGSYELFDKGVRRKVLHKDERYEELYGNLWGFSWAKVIKAELLSDVKFPDGYWFEDTMISYLLYPKCKNAYTLSDVVYRYRRNKMGFSHIRGNNIRLLDSFWVLDSIINLIKESGNFISNNMYDCFLKSMVTCSRRLMYMNNEIRREVLEAFSELLNDRFEEYRSQDKQLSIFEKTVRNNDYAKYVKVVLWAKE